jgi:hypothetical protein
MRGPNPDEMQAPTGNTIAWAEAVDDEDRNWADADTDAMVAARMIAIPRIHISSIAPGRSNGRFCPQCGSVALRVGRIFHVHVRGRLGRLAFCG